MRQLVKANKKPAASSKTAGHAHFRNNTR